jgi:ATP/maltotriose-dependent transcriptional regulator MalT
MTIGTPTLGETPETVSRALAAAQRYGNPRLLAEVHCIVACAKTGKHDPASIARHLRAASVGMAKGTPLWINGKLVESQLAVTRGDISYALTVLNEVQGFVRPAEAPRLQGSVLRQLAVVHHALGRTHDASDLIRASLTIHESHGTRSNYALTRRVADALKLRDRR